MAKPPFNSHEPPQKMDQTLIHGPSKAATGPQGGAKSDDGGGFAKGDILVVGLQDDASIPATGLSMKVPP